MFQTTNQSSIFFPDSPWNEPSSELGDWGPNKGREALAPALGGTRRPDPHPIPSHAGCVILDLMSESLDWFDGTSTRDIKKPWFWAPNLPGKKSSFNHIC